MQAAPALYYVVLTVSDIDASFKYMTESLGFTDEPEESGPGFRQLVGNGGMHFGLLQASDGTPPPGDMKLYFSTPDLDGLRVAWARKGLEATAIESRPFGRIFSVRTPDNHVLTMVDQPVA